VALDSIIGSTAHLSVSNGLGVGLFHTYEPFEEDDDWIWGELQGKCDGSEVGVSDGGNELARRLNNPQPQPYRIGYTSIETSYADGNEYWDYDEGKGRLFWADVLYNHCLSSDELTYHLWESDDIIYTYQGQGGERPSGKDFISLEIEDEIIPGGGLTTRFHYYKIKYGIPYIIYND
jgi:hypothetical protein